MFAQSNLVRSLRQIFVSKSLESTFHQETMTRSTANLDCSGNPPRAGTTYAESCILRQLQKPRERFHKMVRYDSKSVVAVVDLGGEPVEVD